MKLVKIRDSIRNDFWADYECEHCGHKLNDKAGYHDGNYLGNVIPNAICPNCNKSSSGETKEEQIKRLGGSYAI
jgi:hypothetical protein